MIRMRLFSVLAAGACLAGAGMASPAMASAQGPQYAHGEQLPAHIFAPYFEAYLTDSPATLAQQSGAKYLTMAFLQTPAPGSCTVTWNGDPTTPVSAAVYGEDIAKIRATGGDIIPSFGGYGADHGGTEIADSCTSVPAIAAAYENVITTYNVTRLDLDTEDSSLTNVAAIDRRNKAIRLVEDWAEQQGRRVQFVYTLPTNTTGLGTTGVNVLQNAVQNHARIDIVNIMTFDYYDNKPHEMAQDTANAAGALQAQLHTVYPHRTSAQLWAMTGITEMVGIDDFGPPEVFTTADAQNVEDWARSTGIAEVSFWALQRDNGGCVGTGGSNTCSGVTQQPYQFSHIFEPFTR
ncbi:MAG: Chitinase [Actinomycetia bacterium]|nr:Chitinase [Actinomycetes bacterium]